MQFVRGFFVLAAISTVATLSSCSSSAGGNSVVPTYSMGERAQAGPIIYTVLENRWMPQLGAGPTARIPANRFFLLRVSMVNSGSTDTMPPAMTLVDDNGQRYKELTDGEGVPEWIGSARRIKPADTLTGTVVFDVPARHYKLEVTDEMEEKKAIVDLPLSFNVDSVPMPQAPTGGDTLPQPRPVAPK